MVKIRQPKKKKNRESLLLTHIHGCHFTLPTYLPMVRIHLGIGSCLGSGGATRLPRFEPWLLGRTLVGKLSCDSSTVN